jgi:putative PIN family toxin of toxin-antitoxin system
MKVVFDTNIYISAIVIPGSQAEKAIRRIAEGKDALFISKPIISEILSVLSKKFSRDSEALSRVAVFLSDLATLVHPAKRIHVIADEPDNRIIECAVSGKADAIVTGDKEMLDLKDYLGIKIITLKEYLSS